MEKTPVEGFLLSDLSMPINHLLKTNNFLKKQKKGKWVVAKESEREAKGSLLVIQQKPSISANSAINM